MSSRRSSRHEEHEEHENHERWLVTYADMVTLLMVLFIVMFAISQVDQRKFAQLRDGLSAGFGAQDSILDGAQSFDPEIGSQPVAPQLQQASADPVTRARVQQAVDESARLERDRRSADAKAELDRLEGVRKRLDRALTRAGLATDVRASYDERGLVLSLVSRHVVFENDRAVLTERGARVVARMGAVLRGIPDDIQVDGHTNQAPGKPRYYATDWDLSAARALTVLGLLQRESGLPEHRLSLAAFGHTRPLVDPSRADSQEVNKRVDVVVLAGTEHETSALLPGLARARSRWPGATAPEHSTQDQQDQQDQQDGGQEPDVTAAPPPTLRPSPPTPGGTS